VIKFRCPRCKQKIAVDDEGAGIVIACPTCTENIIIPPETAEEFRQPPAPPVVALVPCPAHTHEASGPVPAAAYEQHAQAAAARAGLLPHLARLMMNRLVQTLVLQRRNLMATQENAALRVDDLERRIDRVQQQFQRRLQTYEQRIAELEAELAGTRHENRELAHANMQHARRVMELERLRKAAEAQSHHAAVLLRA